MTNGLRLSNNEETLLFVFNDDIVVCACALLLLFVDDWLLLGGEEWGYTVLAIVPASGRLVCIQIDWECVCVCKEVLECQKCVKCVLDKVKR